MGELDVIPYMNDRRRERDKENHGKNDGAKVLALLWQLLDGELGVVDSADADGAKPASERRSATSCRVDEDALPSGEESLLSIGQGGDALPESHDPRKAAESQQTDGQ